MTISPRRFQSWALLTFIAIIASGISMTANANDISERRSITVSGQGEAMAPPDTASINAGVQTEAATAAEAASQNQALIAKIMQALDDQGVDEKDIRTSDYSIWPQQRHDNRNSGDAITITGYRVSNTVTVTVRDVANVGEILGAVTEAGANTINGINFTVKDSAALEAEARKLAMADARAKAESLAELAGAELGEVLQISMSSGNNYPRPMAMAMARMESLAAAPPSISPGQSSISVSVQVSWEIR